MRHRRGAAAAVVEVGRMAAFTERNVNTSNDGKLSVFESSYPAGSLDVDQDQTFSQVERGMPVRLIATLEGLVTANPQDSVHDALAKVSSRDFDYLPVRLPGRETIVGIISAEKLQVAQDGTVADIYEHLGPDDLISADT